MIFIDAYGFSAKLVRCEHVWVDSKSTPFMFDEMSNYLGTFIVQDVEFRMSTLSIQKLMWEFNGLQIVVCRFRFQCARQNGVRVPITCYHEMIISFSGGNRKTARFTFMQFSIEACYLDAQIVRSEWITIFEVARVSLHVNNFMFGRSIFFYNLHTCDLVKFLFVWLDSFWLRWI